MKIILLDNIEKLGKKRDVKHVATGYARNFLFPRGLAKLATRDALDELEDDLRKREQLATQGLQVVEDLVESLDGFEISFFAKVSEGQTLYAAVAAADIQKKLQELGFKVKEEAIKIKEPIKEVGEYKVVLEFEHGLEAEIKLVVEAEKEK